MLNCGHLINLLNFQLLSLFTKWDNHLLAYAYTFALLPLIVYYYNSTSIPTDSSSYSPYTYHRPLTTTTSSSSSCMPPFSTISSFLCFPIELTCERIDIDKSPINRIWTYRYRYLYLFPVILLICQWHCQFSFARKFSQFVCSSSQQFISIFQPFFSRSGLHSRYTGWLLIPIRLACTIEWVECGASSSSSSTSIVLFA